MDETSTQHMQPVGMILTDSMQLADMILTEKILSIQRKPVTVPPYPPQCGLAWDGTRPSAVTGQ
jgi:hypothetical protein